MDSKIGLVVILVCWIFTCGVSADEIPDAVEAYHWKPPLKRLGMLDMVIRPVTVRELELIDEQTKAVDAAIRELREGFARAAEDAKTMDEKEQGEFSGIMYYQLRQNAREKITNVLLDHQVQRLKQLVLKERLRSEGIMSVIHSSDIAPEIGQIGFDDRQKGRIEKVANDESEKLREKLRSLNIEYRKKVLQATRESRSRVFAELTPRQRKEFDRLLGPIDTDN